MGKQTISVSEALQDDSVEADSMKLGELASGCLKYLTPENWIQICQTACTAASQGQSIPEALSKTIEQFTLDSGIAAANDIEESQYHTIVSDEINELQPRSTSSSSAVEQLSKHTPLRLLYEERELLRLLESTMYISEYTSCVDMAYGAKGKTIVRQIKNICSILSGLVISKDYSEGQKLLKEKDFSALALAYAATFEIGRRYAVMNPEKAKEWYGQLMYFLMDTQNPSIKDSLGFDCKESILLVYDFALTKNDGLACLNDPLMAQAIDEVYTDDANMASLLIRQKEHAVKQLVAKYGRHSRGSGNPLTYLRNFLPGGEASSKELTEQDIERMVYSLRDHNTFLRYNCRPIERMYDLLLSTFSEDDGSLSIVAGVDGARLTHPHSRQFMFVKQTLNLWKSIMKNFYQLWLAVDNDMLDESNTYRIMDTGQGFQRVQKSTSVLHLMHDILRGVQKSSGGWVGSSAIHIGDRTVPNGLSFIDKYVQVPLIIVPIMHVFDQLDKLYPKDVDIRGFVDAKYGTLACFKREVLQDFFRHAFDGSGADNFYDAGSCIDGRLTSCWNWCNNIAKKPYYHIFVLCGFVGFNGV